MLSDSYEVYLDTGGAVGCDTNAVQDAEPRIRSSSVCWQSGGAEAGSSTEYLSNYQTGMKLSRHRLTLCLPKTKLFLPLPWTPLLLMPM